MTAVRIKVTTERTGVSREKVNEEVVKAFVAGVLQDHRETPDHFAKTGRNGRTPFKRTGELVDPVTGFFFKPASKGAARTGFIGTIRAPSSRFAKDEVRDRFLSYLRKLWSTIGIGFSKAGL